MDDFDVLRRSGETVLWRSSSVRANLKWELVAYALLVFILALGVLSWGLEPQDFVLEAVCLLGFPIIWLINNRPRTEVTEERVLHLRDRIKDAYSCPLTDIASVGLEEWSVRICRKDGAIDTLLTRSPAELANAISDAMGVRRPQALGLLAYLGQGCYLVSLAILYPPLKGAIPGIVNSPMWIGTKAALLVAIVPALSAMTMIIAVPAFLLMPVYATPEQAEAWFRLSPAKPLKWIGWKSRPYRWLAALAYRGQLSLQDRT